MECAAKNRTGAEGLVRGEALDAVSRESQAPTHELEGWKRVFLAGFTSQGQALRGAHQGRDLRAGRSKVSHSAPRICASQHQERREKLVVEPVEADEGQGRSGPGGVRRGALHLGLAARSNANAPAGPGPSSLRPSRRRGLPNRLLRCELCQLHPELVHRTPV